ncbi:hypothetical protein D3C73_565070 [compost metagenome]
MTWKRTIGIGLFVVLTLVFVLSRFYMNVQNQHWDQTAKAVELAYEKSILAKAIKVEPFYGDESFQIIYGEDKIGQKLVAWVSEQDVHVEMVDEAFTEEQIRQLMLDKDPELEILRVMPGKMKETYVWEVFYKKHENSGVRYFYEYYQFSDGTYIDTYRLSLQ